MHASIFFLAGGICFLYGLYSLHSRYQASRWLSNIPILGFDQNDDWRRYQDDYRSLIRSGYAKYSRHGQIFRTKNPDGGWRIIISLDHLRQIKHASNKTLSWQRQIQDQLMMTHTAAPDRPPWSAKMIRVELNRKLDDLTDYMVMQINDSFSRMLPSDESNFHEVNVLQLFRQAVAQITTRVFSSEELARDQEWNHAVNRFTADGFGAAFAVREYHPWLRYAASFFLPAVHRIREDKQLARRKLGPLFSARLAAMKDPAYKAPVDGMQWLIEAGGSELTLDVLADTMIRIMMAAVHTTAQTSTYALMHLLTGSDLALTLRAEIVAALDGAKSTKDLTASLPKTESCIKESARLAPLGLIMVGRKVMQPLIFADGTHIPPGNSIFVPTEAVSNDPEIFANPDSFDGLRFHRMRQQGDASENTKWILGNAIEESTGFGYGAQACPGRWFAAREMILLFAKLLGDYEVEWAPARSAEPRARYLERALKAPTEFYMRVRQRSLNERVFPLSPRDIATS